MVVILLLPPYSTNGCDGRSSNESSSPASSTTSTGDTAIPSASYAGCRLPKTGHEDYNNNNRAGNGSYYATTPPLQISPTPPTTTTDPSLSSPATGIALYEYNHNQHNNATADDDDDEEEDERSHTSHYHCFQSPASISPPPPPLPKSKPPSYVPLGGVWYHHQPPPQPKLCNIVPKPPRYRSQPTLETIPEHVSDPPPPLLASDISATAKAHQEPKQFNIDVNKHRPKKNFPPPATTTKTFNNSNYFTNTTSNNYVRHVTRVNFYDIDTSQVEYESRDYDGDDADNKDDCDLDDDNDCKIEAVTKEGK